jgi:tRNA dimethylallyltransferase
MTPRPLLVLVGPTASGKTGFAERLAGALPLRLISADSQQVYRGMDIGTAKPLGPDREAWALLDVVDPGQSFSAGEFCRQAAPLCEAAWAEGKLPVIAGGTGLYLKALLQGLAEIPPIPDEVRAGLEAEFQSHGLAPLLALLDEADPILAATVDRQNPRRILRALEVFEATGQPLSQWQAQTTTPALVPGKALWLGLDPGKEALEKRITQRVDACLATGWLDEVKALAARWGQDPLRKSAAIGYPELLDVSLGAQTLDQAREAILLRTKQYAKRQRTWFKAQEGILWGTGEDDPRLPKAMSQLLN